MGGVGWSLGVEADGGADAGEGRDALVGGRGNAGGAIGVAVRGCGMGGWECGNLRCRGRGVVG